MFCDRCGGSNRAEARFCRVCGVPVWRSGALPDDSEAITIQSPPLRRLSDRYVVLGEVGRGGLGVVYAAEDPVLGRPVAIKVLRPEISGDPGMIQRLLSEARIAARLRHPNIVSIHDLGLSDEGHFIVMDFIDGRNLAQLIGERGALTVPEATRIVLDICRAIAHAHDAGVIHRDLKPENIMLDQNAHVLVTDFGLARAPGSPRLTIGGAVVGSPGYMSPEQFRGERDLSAATDVFSTGLILYFLLAGRALFDGASLYEIHEQHARWRIEPALRELEVREEILEVLRAMLARRAEDRLPDLRLWLRFPAFRAL